MRLECFRITNFRSVEDSGKISLGDMVCLVGKNEAGKTALLQALAGLNPHPSTPIEFDKERDYPRRFLNDYAARHPKEGGEASVVSTTWTVTPDEMEPIAARIGASSLRSDKITVSKRYGSEKPEVEAELSCSTIKTHLVEAFGLNEEDSALLAGATTTDEIRKVLEALEEPSEAHTALLTEIRGWPGQNATNLVADTIRSALPRFMYFSYYDRMAGEIRVDDIVRNGPDPYHRPGSPHGHAKLDVHERVFLDFLEFAGTSVEEISASDTYESLNAKCEAASNSITDELREYWTQNPFLEIEVRVTKAEPKDPAPFNTGVIARARVKNTLHRVTVPFSERSAGFIWFFSFLVKFAQVSKEEGELVLLLDEPGLTLHGKAQADLLRYFSDRLVPQHQVVFSTHSPFMVPPDDLTLSRIVEDQIEQRRPGLWTTKGTKVRDDVLATDPDTLFPLQGALGYDVTQTLFIGRDTLLLEGPGDILFLKALSAQLKRRKRTQLDPRWTLCPAGGIDKIQSFVSLFSGRASINVAVLTDMASGDKRKLEQLKRSAVVPESRILNYPEVLGLPEGDIEDIFDPETYLGIVNGAFELKGRSALTVAKLDKDAPPPGRLVKRVEAVFKLFPASTPEFDHFSPADWLIRNPILLDGDGPGVAATLDNAEKVIKAVNGTLAV